MCNANRQKEYYSKNRDRVLAINAKCRLKNHEKVLSDKKAYYERIKDDPEWKAAQKAKREAGRDSKRAYDKKYREKNKEQRIAKEMAWKAANPGKVREIKKAWKKRNPEYVTTDAQNRRAMLRKADGKFSAKDVKYIFEKQRGLCAACSVKIKKSGKNNYHIDHIVPLAKGGSNWPNNLQLLCPPCNLRKSAKDPIQWANENGKLL